MFKPDSRIVAGLCNNKSPFTLISKTIERLNFDAFLSKEILSAPVKLTYVNDSHLTIVNNIIMKTY